MKNYKVHMFFTRLHLFYSYFIPIRFYSHFLLSVEVYSEDCVFGACAVETCGGEVITCTRTCVNGVFGDVGCASGDELMSHTCDLLPCGTY